MTTARFAFDATLGGRKHEIAFTVQVTGPDDESYPDRAWLKEALARVAIKMVDTETLESLVDDLIGLSEADRKLRVPRQLSMPKTDTAGLRRVK